MTVRLTDNICDELIELAIEAGAPRSRFSTQSQTTQVFYALGFLMRDIKIQLEARKRRTSQ